MPTFYKFEITVTQNIGDYSNARVTLGFSDLPVEDGVAGRQTLIERIDAVIDDVHRFIDEELELSGNRPRYSGDPLYDVMVNDDRECILIFPAQVSSSLLPTVPDWKHRDIWNRPWTHTAEEFSDRLSFSRAVRFSELLAERFVDYQTAVVTVEDIFAREAAEVIRSAVPRLPEPGPEPEWSKKKIGGWLKSLDIPAVRWDDVAVYPWVDVDYLRDIRSLRTTGQIEHGDDIADYIIADDEVLAELESADEEVMTIE